MELNDFKSLWQAEKQKLEARIEATEQLLKKRNSENAFTKLDGLVKNSISGRNLVLIYGLASLSMGILAFSDFVYSIPCILGGLAMICLFRIHLVIKKPNYSALSTFDLQKFITQYRIHVAKTAKYDLGIIVFWLLTFAPVLLKQRFQIPLYSDIHHMQSFGLVVFFVLVVSAIMYKPMYEEIDNQLKESEERLTEVLSLEKLS